jgi:hypothetical protein
VSDAGWTAVGSILVAALMALAEVIKEYVRAKYGVDVVRSAGRVGNGQADHPAQTHGGQAPQSPPPVSTPPA